MRRYLPERLHLSVASGLLFVILVLVYQIVSRHNQRIDVTGEQIHSVASETLEVLKRMKRSEIKLYAFFTDDKAGP